jgi:hypothetical protein
MLHTGAPGCLEDCFLCTGIAAAPAAAAAAAGRQGRSKQGGLGCRSMACSMGLLLCCHRLEQQQQPLVVMMVVVPKAEASKVQIRQLAGPALHKDCFLCTGRAVAATAAAAAAGRQCGSKQG